MTRNRMEAFSDGVMAIIITIMVLEMRPPHGAELAALRPLLAIFVSYVISFIYIGIYWNNHHHLLHTVQHVNGPTLWANMHLLFWLSLVPFSTAWMGENDFARWPVVLYGVLLLGAAVAYHILVRTLIAHHGADSTVAHAIGRDYKGKISVLIYAAGIGLAFVNPWLGFSAYVLVAAIWLVPDRRIERELVASHAIR